jgi:adenylate cyclase
VTNRRVEEFLAGLGATEEEIRAASSQGRLALLVVERLLMPPGPLFTRLELSERTGMPLETSRRLWRALGFADNPDDEPVYTELDVEAVSIVQGLLSLGLADIESALQLGRVLGTSMARLAEAQVTMTQVRGVSELGDEEAAERFALVADATLPSIARLIEYAWRRHLLAAARRAVMSGGVQDEGLPQMQVPMAVGFADMVGFTLLAQQLPDSELGRVIARFEEVAYDTISARGGRIVKMIGDEVMFVAEDPFVAARIALALIDAHASDPALSDLRVGLAYGTVIARDGDYFGPVVNLASRIVDIARPGTVLASAEFREAAGEGAGGEFAWKAVRVRYLRDIGRVQVWSLRHPDRSTEKKGDVIQTANSEDR